MNINQDDIIQHLKIFEDLSQEYTNTRESNIIKRNEIFNRLYQASLQ